VFRLLKRECACFKLDLAALQTKDFGAAPRQHIGDPAPERHHRIQVIHDRLEVVALEAAVAAGWAPVLSDAQSSMPASLLVWPVRAPLCVSESQPKPDCPRCRALCFVQV